MVGISIGDGIVVCQLAKSDRGMARIELGRSTFRRASSPSYLPYVVSSLSYLVVPEPPLEANLSAMVGLARYDSDNDDESNLSQIYSFDWKPQARV